MSVQSTSPPSSPSEGAKLTADYLGAHHVSSVFSHLLRQKKDRNPPPIDESLGTDGVSSDLSRFPPHKKDRNPSQSTTLSVITASRSSVLVFSDVRRLYQSSKRLLLRRAMSSVWRSASGKYVTFSPLSYGLVMHMLVCSCLGVLIVMNQDFSVLKCCPLIHVTEELIYILKLLVN